MKGGGVMTFIIFMRKNCISVGLFIMGVKSRR